MKRLVAGLFLSLLLQAGAAWAKGTWPPATMPTLPTPPAVLPRPATGNFQGLWWSSPAGSQSGWAVQITQQGSCTFERCDEVIVATWFTYDSDGSPMWLIVSNARNTGARLNPTYAGTLYRATGPSLAANPWSSAQVRLTPVGTASIWFASPNEGFFGYSFDPRLVPTGHTASMPITRYRFASPSTRCTISAAQGSSVPNYTDTWWRSPPGSESGWGIGIAHEGDVVTATWYTYGPDGSAEWLVMSRGVRTAERTYSGTLYRARGPAFNAKPWDSSQVVMSVAGSATLLFTDDDNGTFAYTVDGISDSKPITRYIFATPKSVCR